MSIPLPTRQKIAHEFGIAKVRSISVVNDVVMDDGYDIRNVENSLSVEAMQNFTESKEKDPNTLLDLVIAKVNAVVEVIPQPIIPPIIEKPKPVDKTEGLVSKVIKSPVKTKKKK